MRNPIKVLRQKLWPDDQVKGDWFRSEPILYQPPDSVRQSDESFVPRRPGWMLGSSRRKEDENNS
jgi:hypothetical protein